MSESQGQEFGAFVRKHREAVGLSQTALAARAGITRGYLNRIETGKVPKPSRETRAKLLEAMERPDADYPPVTEAQAAVLARDDAPEILARAMVRAFLYDDRIRTAIRESTSDGFVDNLQYFPDEALMSVFRHLVVERWSDRQKAMLLWYINEIDSALREAEAKMGPREQPPAIKITFGTPE